MNFFYPLFVFLMFGHVIVCGQLQGFQKTFGGLSNDHGFDVISTADGGYALAGYSNSYTNGDYDALLIKLDSNGNQQWSRIYGGTGNDQALQLVQTPDGGFALAGKTTSYGSGNFDAMLIRTDPSGYLLWMKTYGGPQEERILNIRQTSDQGFIMAGSTQSFGQGNWDMLYIRTDSVGDTLWTKILGGPDYDQGTDADQTSDGGFVFLGRETNGGSGFPDVCLIKTDADGNREWTLAYGGSYWDEGMKVKQTFDEGFIVTGGSTSFTNISYDAFLTKIDPTGHINWSKLYSGLHNDATYDVIQLADSGYVIVGETESFGINHLRNAGPDYFASQNRSTFPNNVQGTDHSNVFAVRTTANGDTLWTRAYGGGSLDESYAVIQTRDRGFMIVAYSSSYTNDSIDVYLIKTDSMGFSGCYEMPAGPDVLIPVVGVVNTNIKFITGLSITNVSHALINPLVAQHNACLVFSVEEEPFIPVNTVTIYPNPADRFLTVRISSPVKYKIEAIKIFDMAEREILKTKVSSLGTGTNDEATIDVSNLMSGVYFLQAGTARKRFVKL